MTDQSNEQTKAKERVVQAVKAYEQARAERDAAIAAASNLGVTSREVGALAGMTHSRVQQIRNEQAKRGALTDFI
jgi:hypothetical protein